MEAWRPTDEQLIDYAALHGARGVYARAFDSGIDAMRAENADNEKFIQDCFELAKLAGFAGLGLGFRRGILDALQFAVKQQNEARQK